ncbi:MAG: hypothetical protein SNJ75_14505, partial [Gemmataceae bacterium]
GTYIGIWWIDPIQVRPPDASMKVPFKIPDNNDPQVRKQLEIHAWRFLNAQPVVAGLIFAITGLTMFLSSLGRYRWRVMGIAVVTVLLMFMINVLGQMWEPAAVLRPWTLFYYFQPQQVIPLDGEWTVSFYDRPIPMLAVLYGTGIVGYGLAFVILARRDLPAPL